VICSTEQYKKDQIGVHSQGYAAQQRKDRHNDQICCEQLQLRVALSTVALQMFTRRTNAVDAQTLGKQCLTHIKASPLQRWQRAG
jgi:hypothetical protein